MSTPNTLVINCDLRETRVALIEDGVIAELQIERAAHRGTVGNIVLGKVTRVLPGMQAAFIDVGMERAAFLHVEDLIRPDDFEAYLSGDFGEIDKSDGGKEAARDSSADGDGSDADADSDRGAPAEEDDDEELLAASDADYVESDGHTHGYDDDDEEEDDDDEEALDFDSEEDDDDDATSDTTSSSEGGPDGDTYDDDDLDDDDDWDDGDDGDDDTDDDDDDPDDDSGADGPAEDDAAHEADDEPAAVTSDAMDSGRVERRRAPKLPETDEEEEEEGRSKRRRRRRRTGGTASGGAAATPATGRGEGRGEGRSEGRSEGRGEGRSEGRSEGRGEGRAARGERRGPGPRAARRGNNGPARGRGNAPSRKTPSRNSRDVPITEVVKEGDQVIVQISKEPIGTKGARVTSHVSLPGRYCVFLPTVDHIGISKRIGSASERTRLRKVIEAMKPKSGGIIVRTVAAGLTKKSLKADLGYLMRLWGDVSKRVESAKAPTILYAELDLVLKTARDLFTDQISKIVIDDKEQYAKLVRFVGMFLPERVKDIELYKGDEPIFDAYGIEDEITRALSRKVPLPSGGYLIIDQAEALSAIDVNTGRFVGKGSGSLEETALKTNLEAVEEIAYQLRFRNLGGLVVLDLIDMEDRKNREKVYRALDQALKKDKAKTTINRISDLGLIEMTRKRTRESLSRTMHEPCFYCDGTGQIQSRTTIAYEILRQIRRERNTLPGYSIVVNAHPAVIDLLQSEEKASIKEVEALYMRRVKLIPRKEYHIEQFDLQGQ